MKNLKQICAMPLTIGISDSIISVTTIIGRRDKCDVNLLKRRKACCMTQESVSKKSGISQNYYSQLENGRCVNPSRAVLRRLAMAFDCTVAQLYGEVDECTDQAIDASRMHNVS
jgi:DNA-binding XRE family transcriptional regulator